ncbi:mitochondrial carrier domain-containing protein [Choanephora cucurbitarum]|nr:mitochondrial carrier domain-containing protein [Choanephora cucurbitarum]
MSNPIDSYYVFASSAAGLVARTITHPIDTINIRLQTTTLRSTQPRSAHVFKTIIFPDLVDRNTSFKEKMQSIKGLYRGLPVALFFAVPALSVYLSCYESTKQKLSTTYHVPQDSSLNHLISGCAAEVAGGLLFTPMEVMKNRLQTQRGQHVRLRLFVSNIYKQEGLRGFFRGYWMGLAVFVPHSMAYFATYEKLKQWVLSKVDKKHFGIYMACSSTAGVASILISTPLDIIKTRWQISAAEQGKAYRDGPIAIAKNMLLKEGRGAFVRGIYARIAWGIPTTAISMTVFEVLKDNKSKILSILN